MLGYAITAIVAANVGFLIAAALGVSKHDQLMLRLAAQERAHDELRATLQLVVDALRNHSGSNSVSSAIDMIDSALKARKTNSVDMARAE